MGPGRGHYFCSKTNFTGQTRRPRSPRSDFDRFRFVGKMKITPTGRELYMNLENYVNGFNNSSVNIINFHKFATQIFILFFFGGFLVT